jgi:hypothetical protein
MSIPADFFAELINEAKIVANPGAAVFGTFVRVM